jgi:hypothetical protein
MLRRTLYTTASVSALLAIAFSSAAYAGEDDDPALPAPPPPTTPTTPVPPPPPPATKPQPKPEQHKKHESGGQSGGQSGSNSGSNETAAQETQSVSPQFQVAGTTQVSTTPVGAVQAGGGGTAEGSSGSALLGLGAGFMLVATAGGGLALRRRPDEA